MNKLATLSLLLCTAASAQASSLLSSNISLDNGYELYLSTDDNVEGDLIGMGNNWFETFHDEALLEDGVNYYLHVKGYDQGWIAGFLGSFSLSGNGHAFSNGGSSLNTNTVDWQGNNTGWGDAYAQLTNLGQNSSAWPWFDAGGGARPGIDGDAHWVWSGDAYDNDLAYFSTKISAVSSVPLPGAVWLMGSALMGFLGVSRRKTA